MRIDVLSLFPDMFKPTLGQSIVGRAQDDGFLDIHVTDFRHFTTDKHNHVDDAPFGGGAGMLLQAQPILMRWRPLMKKHKRKLSERPCHLNGSGGAQV